MDRSNPRLMIADNPYIVSGKLCIYTIYSVLCPKSIDWDLKDLFSNQRARDPPQPPPPWHPLPPRPPLPAAPSSSPRSWGGGEPETSI